MFAKLVLWAENHSNVCNDIKRNSNRNQELEKHTEADRQGENMNNNNNNKNIDICIVPYGRNFRGAGPGSVLVGVRRGKRVSLREEKSL